MDPTRFTTCAPAMKNVKIKNDKEFTFDIAAGGRNIGFTATWSELAPPQSARLKMEGGGRLTGGARLDNTFKIAPDGDDGSTVDWTSIVDVFGAARLVLSDERIESMVNGMNAEVIDCIRRQIETE
jgi:carbon monoxide dehydrogenase subunit G